MFIYFMRWVVYLRRRSSNISPQNSLILAAGRQGQFSSSTPLYFSHSLSDSFYVQLTCLSISFFYLFFSIIFNLSSSLLLSYQHLISQIIPIQFWQVGLRQANFLADSMPLLMRQLTTQVMFFQIYFLSFGYFMVLTLPICMRMITEPTRAPFSNGFYYILSAVLLLFREYSQPNSFFIQFSTLEIVYGVYSGVTTRGLTLTPCLAVFPVYLGIFYLLLFDYYCVLLMLFLRLV